MAHVSVKPSAPVCSLMYVLDVTTGNGLNNCSFTGAVRDIGSFISYGIDDSQYKMNYVVQKKKVLCYVRFDSRVLGKFAQLGTTVQLEETYFDTHPHTGDVSH